MKLKNPLYWRLDLEREAMERSRACRRSRATRDSTRRDTIAVVYESERLAREFFARSERGDQAESIPALHPEAKLAPSYDPSSCVSRADFVAHLASEETPQALDAVAQSYRPLDDERIVVEGRVRLRRPEGGFADRPMVWALVFRDGLLYRSWALDSVREAEARLERPSD